MYHKKGYVYILSNKDNNVMYVGVTSNLINRVRQHKEKVHPGFTARYNVNKLVYYEVFSDIRVAIHRESQLKNWKREWKGALVEKSNPSWKDISLLL